MNIVVKFMTGKSVNIFVELRLTIQKLKQKITLIQEIPTNQQRLIFAGQLLQDNKTIAQYGMHQDSVIHIVLKLRGGSLTDFQFNNMGQLQIYRVIQAKQEDLKPQWKFISQGLNLQGICKNKNCQAFNKKVWTHKGYGKFNMSMESNKSQCPICRRYCQQVNNFGIYQARCKCKGRIRGQQKERQSSYSQTLLYQFLTFVDKDQTRLNQLYLQLEVVQL